MLHGNSIFTDELGRRIIDYAREGNYFVTCAELVEIDESTLYDWINKGLGNPSEYPELYKFAKSLKQARAQAHRAALQTVRSGMTGKADGMQWQGEAWFLERTNRELFGRKESIDMKADVNVNLNNLSEEQLAKVREAAAIVEGAK